MNIGDNVWNVIKWVFVVLFMVLILVLIFWTVFHSKFFANDQTVIQLRNGYRDTYAKVAEVIPGLSSIKTPYTIEPQKPKGVGTYTYVFSGKFSGIDTVNYNIYLSGSDGRLYTFDIRPFILKDDDTWLRIYSVPNVGTLAKGNSYPMNTLPPEGAVDILESYNVIKVTNNIPGIKFDSIGVRWNDKRNLSQIENDFSKYPTIPLNQDNPESTVLTRFQ